MSSPVAVIDIGSNSIKVLVAKRSPEGPIEAVHMKTLDARISAGISRDKPRLSDEGMARGLGAVKVLVADANDASAVQIAMVATSAVRDAENGRDFCASIHRETGIPVRILDGQEEANYIGRGLTCDPALRNLKSFYLFDLGGGSLECLSFRDRKIVQEKSLALGCVRLTERCVRDVNAPFSVEDQRRISELSKEVLAKSGFHFHLPPDAVAVGTGGTITTARAILGARRGLTLEATDTLVTVAELRELLAYLGRASLEDRRRLPAVPHARADVLPAALTTVIALAEMGGFHAFRHSLYNLRWGVADEMLAGQK